jgi:hypothetical protein
VTELGGGQPQLEFVLGVVEHIAKSHIRDAIDQGAQFSHDGAGRQLIADGRHRQGGHNPSGDDRWIETQFGDCVTSE